MTKGQKLVKKTQKNVNLSEKKVTTYWQNCTKNVKLSDKKPQTIIKTLKKYKVKKKLGDRKSQHIMKKREKCKLKC